jgi:hypothetical protein
MFFYRRKVITFIPPVFSFKAFTMGGSASRPQVFDDPVVKHVMVEEPPTVDNLEQSAAYTICKSVGWPMKHYHGLLWAHPIRIMRMNKDQLDDLEERLAGEFQQVLGAFGDNYVAFNLCDGSVQIETLRQLDHYRDDYSKVVLKIAERRKALTPDGGDW